MIGYMLDQAVGNELPTRDVATLLTRVIVDPDDPAFDRPTKPVGLNCDEQTAVRLAAAAGGARPRVAGGLRAWWPVVSAGDP